MCRVDGTVYRGRAVTVDKPVDPQTLARAVSVGEATDRETTVTVRARTPGPVHERVGCLRPEMGLRVRTALAAAARSRGHATAVDGEIRALRQELSDLRVEDVETAAQREAVAAASADTERLREEAAERRGELAARRDGGDDAVAAAEQFRERARELSEAETSAVEARQDLQRRRREARAARDRLERRFALEDELANRRREARRRLVSRVEGAFEGAVETVPGSPQCADPFEADSLTAALAIARLADIAAPVVLACDCFGDADAASAWLRAPVIDLAQV